MADRDAALRAMSDVALVIAAEPSVEPILEKLVASARELAGARYAALGIPDGEGGFARFVTAGMSDELVAAMGPLPRTHGLLGAMLEPGPPYRTGDIRRDPRFRGWWPGAHPEMRSFLGVPIVSRSGAVAAFYLTDKEDAPEFTAEDQLLIEMLAAHAAIAIEKARLYERSRELSIVEERNRLARELHDSVTHQLFGLVLTAEAAATLIDRDPSAAKAQLRQLQDLAQDAMEELRGLIFELRPPDLAEEGVAGALRKHVDVVRRAYRRDVQLEIAGEPALPLAAHAEVLRIAQEALQNAVRHARAERIEVRLDAGDGRVRLSIRDDGVGFDPAGPDARGRRLGLTSMEERARALGGTLTIASRPGAGAAVTLEVPQ